MALQNLQAHINVEITNIIFERAHTISGFSGELPSMMNARQVDNTVLERKDTNRFELGE